MALASSYKKRHGPNLSENSKWHQGYFIPTKNPKKCLTKENIFRSSWEQSFMMWCDSSDKVVRWASEPIKVPYRNPIGNLEYCKKNNLNPKDPKNWSVNNYWTDFWCELLGADGKIQKIFIEIKPYAQTQKPEPITTGATLKEYRSYNHNAQTYLQNMAKWAAAKRYFEERGCVFAVWTERTLEKLGCL